jgi:hypothetical protein
MNIGPKSRSAINRLCAQHSSASFARVELAQTLQQVVVVQLTKAMRKALLVDATL